jgi:hypothetical protein
MSTDNWNQNSKLDQYRSQIEKAAYDHDSQEMKGALGRMQDDLYRHNVDGAQFAGELESRIQADGYLPQVKTGVISADFRFIADGKKKIDGGKLEEKARVCETHGDFLEADFLRELDGDKQHKVIKKLDQKHLEQVSNQQNDRLGIQNVITEFGSNGDFNSLAGPKGYISKDDIYVSLSQAHRDSRNADPARTTALQYMYDNFNHMSKDITIGRSPYDGGYATYARGITMASLYGYDEKHETAHANKKGTSDFMPPSPAAPVEAAFRAPEPAPAPPCDDACRDGLRQEGATRQAKTDKVELDLARQHNDSDRKMFGEKQDLYNLATYQVKPDDGYILPELAFSVLKAMGKPTTPSDLKKEEDEIAKNSGLTRKTPTSPYVIKPNQILTVLRPDQLKTRAAEIEAKYGQDENFPL